MNLIYIKILRNRETSNTDDKILLLTIKCIDIKERKEKNLSAIHPLPEFHLELSIST